MRFKKELATSKSKCEKLITLSYENSKVQVGKLKKEIRRKDKIIYHLVLDLPKISAQSTHHPQSQVSLGHQELASVEYHINLPTHSQFTGPSLEPTIMDKIFETKFSFWE